MLLRGGRCLRLSTLPGQVHKTRSYHGAGPSIVWLAYISSSRRISCTCQNYSWLLSLHWYCYNRAMDLRPGLGPVPGCLAFSRWQAQTYRVFIVPIWGAIISLLSKADIARNLMSSMVCSTLARQVVVRRPLERVDDRGGMPLRPNSVRR